MSHRRLLIGLLLVGILQGCFVGNQAVPPPQAGPPPLKVSFRKSQVPFHGLVAGINNPTDQTIQVVAVLVQDAADAHPRTHRLDYELKSLDTMTVGWTELDGWKLKSKDKLTIRCEGFTQDFQIIVE